MPTTLLIVAILAVTTCKVCALEVECGTTNFTMELITNGTRTARGEWPFLTALYLAEENQFFCGGTLISSKHVLTAAHCIRGKGSSKGLRPGDFIVLLGAYDLTLRFERGLQQRDVDQIDIHPEWQAYSDKYDADLAILHLNEIVSFTNFIRPVCLPTNDTAFDNVTGSVVGWGLTETGTGPNLEFIKQASVTVLNGVYCLTENPDAAVISSTRTFCGQGVNGNANKGDSGGGFYVLSGYSWVQFGVVSALRSNAAGRVDFIVVYTNVVKFKDWIVDIVSQSGAAVGEAKPNVETKINLECKFGDASFPYTCTVDNLNIRSDNIAVGSFTGTHVNGKTDDDVKTIVFHSGTMFFIPTQVAKIFKNLKVLFVNENISTKRIKPSDFEGLENLVQLGIYKNDITTFDHDSLRDLHLLERFTLVDNNLTEIDETTFQTNVKLRDVKLSGINLKVLPNHLFTNNLLLDYVNLRKNSLKIIDETTFQTNIKLQQIDLSQNQLETLPRYLFSNNLLLKIVELNNNLLKIIEIDFTTLSSIRAIDLQNNVCIDAYFRHYDFPQYLGGFRNLADFQNVIMSNCSLAVR